MFIVCTLNSISSVWPRTMPVHSQQGAWCSVNIYRAWRSSSITPLRLATAPTRSRLPETTEPSPARLEQGLGLFPLSLGVQNVSGSTSQDQTFGFQPCHILTGWGHTTDLPVLPPRFLSAMAGDPAAGQDTNLPEVLCREYPLQE